MNRTEEKFITEPSRSGFITNYPPFRYWKKEAVKELVDHKPINIYVHIPFCIQRCAYCYYKTITLKESRRTEIDRYIDAVCREIEIGANCFHLKERPVASIYFGGGTPTLLSEENLYRLVKCFQENLNIDKPEFTIEAEPVTLTERKAETMGKLGVNRLSLGIQSFSEAVVKLTGRKDTEEQAFKAIETAKAIGGVVNIDLLSGLAGETKDSWAYSVERALSANVESITVYKMELYANTEYYAGVRNKTLELPSDDQELEFMQYAMEQFARSLYLPVNFFSFTKEGRYVQRHITNRLRGHSFYGFGVSAFGSLGNYSFQNTSDIQRYMAALEVDELPISRGYNLTSFDLMVRDVVLGMKLLYLDCKEFQEKHGFNLKLLCASALSDLEAQGFITLRGDKISLTSKGILFGDYVGRELSEHLQQHFTEPL